jgi:hypothetical protein
VGAPCGGYGNRVCGRHVDGLGPHHLAHPNCAWCPVAKHRDKRDARRLLHAARFLEVPESGAEGVIVAQGGITGGWSVYAKGGKPKYCYNFYGLNRYTVGGPAKAMVIAWPGPGVAVRLRLGVSYCRCRLMILLDSVLGSVLGTAVAGLGPAVAAEVPDL